MLLDIDEVGLKFICILDVPSQLKPWPSPAFNLFKLQYMNIFFVGLNLHNVDNDQNTSRSSDPA